MPDSSDNRVINCGGGDSDSGGGRHDRALVAKNSEYVAASTEWENEEFASLSVPKLRVACKERGLKQFVSVAEGPARAVLLQRLHDFELTEKLHKNRCKMAGERRTATKTAVRQQTRWKRREVQVWQSHRRDDRESSSSSSSGSSSSSSSSESGDSTDDNEDQETSAKRGSNALGNDIDLVVVFLSW